MIVAVGLSSGSHAEETAPAPQDDYMSVAPFYMQPSLDKVPVKIQMRGIHWEIPRNFLHNAFIMKRADGPVTVNSLSVMTCP